MMLKVNSHQWSCNDPTYGKLDSENRQCLSTTGHSHVVKMRKNGYTKELMFDVDTHLLEITGEYENPWGSADKMTRFDRYRPVDGVLIPHRIEYWRGNSMTLETEIQEIKFNEPMDDVLFAYPASAETPAASSSATIRRTRRRLPIMPR